MAVVNVEQREIVEIPFTMPDGTILPHPALVISRNELQVDEDGMFYAVLISTKNYHPEYTIRIEDEWLNKPMGRQSYFITHLVNMFNVDDVIRRNNAFIKKRFLRELLTRFWKILLDNFMDQDRAILIGDFSTSPVLSC